MKRSQRPRQERALSSYAKNGKTPYRYDFKMVVISNHVDPPNPRKPTRTARTILKPFTRMR